MPTPGSTEGASRHFHGASALPATAQDRADLEARVAAASSAHSAGDEGSHLGHSSPRLTRERVAALEKEHPSAPMVEQEEDALSFKSTMSELTPRGTDAGAAEDVLTAIGGVTPSSAPTSGPPGAAAEAATHPAPHIPGAVGVHPTAAPAGGDAEAGAHHALPTPAVETPGDTEAAEDVLEDAATGAASAAAASSSSARPAEEESPPAPAAGATGTGPTAGATDDAEAAEEALGSAAAAAGAEAASAAAASSAGAPGTSPAAASEAGAAAEHPSAHASAASSHHSTAPSTEASEEETTTPSDAGSEDSERGSDTTATTDTSASPGRLAKLAQMLGGRSSDASGTPEPPSAGYPPEPHVYPRDSYWRYRNPNPTVAKAGQWSIIWATDAAYQTALQDMARWAVSPMPREAFKKCVVEPVNPFFSWAMHLTTQYLKTAEQAAHYEHFYDTEVFGHAFQTYPVMSLFSNNALIHEASVLHNDLSLLLNPHTPSAVCNLTTPWIQKSYASIPPIASRSFSPRRR